ncbi:polysaccharide deacetylase family protein [Lutibacter sp. B1]|uniref:polysaccharide deacetylase family protein n=1 Tax=Lutibacter sp. B1 TaxID=2725996 RepID=UPI0014572229|nr:polysaccharide deacetylase family protein [Lutibacter sp. B1]NLP57753.1 polysaccharide deacetylase family protein [Lutibacter sp. B1]
MKPYFIKTPSLIKFIFKNWIWSFSNKEKVIYLTFDDGPTPEITGWILHQLKKYNAKATFFCIGKNINNYPDIFKSILNEEHSVGNHTSNHLNGLKTKNGKYLENILLAEQQIETYSKPKTQNSKLFRPPYGKLKLSQAKKIRKNNYKIIMWDILSADFDLSISKEKCLQNVIDKTKNGSIIVFHDSIKASKNLKFVLPKILEYFSAKGFVFKKIE